MSHGITQGQEADCTIECAECGQEFEGTGTWDVEFHEGYGTRRELFPDEDVCPGCRGVGDCEGTFKTGADGKTIAVECDSTEASTRFCIEDNGSRTHLGIYCDPCQKFYAEADA
ncbi:MAG: hypothetical protein QF615_10415 [Planctomycetota bacterium]|nr:hypothetical protein [Planctomycetota bacterium]